MLKQIASIFGSRLIVKALNLLMAILIARTMGPELQGIVSFLLMVAGLLSTIGTFGMDASTIYFIVRRNVSSYAWLKRVVPVMLTGILLIYLIMAFLILDGTPTYFSPYSYKLLILAGLIIPFDALINQWRNVWLAIGRTSDYNRSDILQTALLLLLVAVALVIRPDSPAAVLLSYVIARVITFTFVFSKGCAASRTIVETVPAPPVKEILRFSVHPWLGNITALLNVRLDAFLVAWFVSRDVGVTAVDLGLYSVCVLAVSRIQEVQYSIQTAYFPRVAELDPHAAAALAARTYRITSPLYIAIFGLTALGAWPALSLFGPAYVDAIKPLILLSFGIIVVRANAGVLALFLSAIGKPHLPMIANSASMVVSVFFNLLLIPHFGIIGAALSSTIAALATKIVLITFFLRHSGGNYRSSLLLRAEDIIDVKSLILRILSTVRARYSRK